LGKIRSELLSDDGSIGISNIQIISKWLHKLGPKTGDILCPWPCYVDHLTFNMKKRTQQMAEQLSLAILGCYVPEKSSTANTKTGI